MPRLIQPTIIGFVRGVFLFVRHTIRFRAKYTNISGSEIVLQFVCAALNLFVSLALRKDMH